MCNNISEYHRVQFVWIVKRRLKIQSDGNKRPSSKNQETNPKQKQTKSKQSNWQNYDKDLGEGRMRKHNSKQDMRGN